MYFSIFFDVYFLEENAKSVEDFIAPFVDTSMNVCFQDMLLKLVITQVMMIGKHLELPTNISLLITLRFPLRHK